MNRLDLRRNAGFSLSEATIVLTAIGLLAGAILFGQDLVASSRGKAVAIELNQLLST